MSTIIKIFESLVKLNNWNVERFDLQGYNYGGGIEGYVGVLDTAETGRILIHDDGSFEMKK